VIGEKCEKHGWSGNEWRENSKFGEKNIEGLSKILGRTYQKREPQVSNLLPPLQNTKNSTISALGSFTHISYFIFLL
jgi:hypothetical protein